MKKTNYCTFAPDRFLKWDWSIHCQFHDREYKKFRKSMTRKEADIMLREGMKSELPFLLHWVAWIYYFVVRVFSKPGWKRWDYNWDNIMNYIKKEWKNIK